jgi:hypothetical protein
MIKFTALIHKETGAVISYIDWLAHLKGHKEIRIEKESPKNNFYVGVFDPLDIILYSDSFEIIYYSEFTTEELELANVSIFECVRRDIIWSNTGNDLSKKIEEIIKKRYENKSKYGIEV